MLRRRSQMTSLTQRSCPLNSPHWRLREDAVAVAHGCRKLRCAKDTRANRFDEVDMRLQGAAGMEVRIENAHLLAELAAYDTYRLQQVGVVGHHHADIEAPHVRVVQE